MLRETVWYEIVLDGIQYPAGNHHEQTIKTPNILQNDKTVSNISSII